MHKQVPVVGVIALPFMNQIVCLLKLARLSGYKQLEPDMTDDDSSLPEPEEELS